MMIKEGDICILDESVEYSILSEKPFEVLVLWNGVNGQPLVTRTNEYRPFWTTYSQLVKVVRHIDLVEALPSVQPEPFINKPCVSEGVCREDKMKVLEKIKAEIETEKNAGCHTQYAGGLDFALSVISKYMAESEEA